MYAGKLMLIQVNLFLLARVAQQRRWLAEEGGSSIFTGMNPGRGRDPLTSKGCRGAAQVSS